MIRPPLTEEQRRAVSTRNVPVVLSSNAGSGKTSVLTARYLSHLERGEASPSRLVAITFTEKAAREMRRRIRAEVEARVASADADRAIWQEHLRELETAQISTIHSFCSSLLRRHALLAGLDPRFTVIETPVAQSMRSAAVRDTLTQLLSESSEISESLRELVRTFGWAKTREAISHLLDGHATDWNDWLRQSPEQIAAAWQDRAAGEIVGEYVRFLMRSSGKIAAAMRLLKSTPCRGPKMADRIAQMQEKLAKLGATANLAAALDEINGLAQVQGTEKEKAWPNAETYDQVKKSLEGFRKSLKDSLAPFLTQEVGVDGAAAIARHFIRVARECKLAYARAKSDAAAMDFNDLLVAARDLVRGHREVVAAFRQRTQFVLVDELQDTDAVQMELIESICGRDIEAGKLFAVGDAKQSIYRFRGAVVELFDELRGRAPEPGRQTLSSNFRSQRGILDFTNALLSRHMENYDPLVHALPPIGDPACVEFLWSPAAKTADESRANEAGRLARRIARMIDTQEKLVTVRTGGQTELRPVKAGDIALLFRAMTNVAIYESALNNLGLDYYLVGGRAFFAQQEVYDLYLLLCALENPHDALSLAAALRSPFGCLSDESLVVLSGHPRGVWTGLHDAATVEQLPEQERATAIRVAGWLDQWRALKDRARLAELVTRILADSGYDAAVLYEHLGVRKLANLWKLVDLARTYDRAGRFRLDDFIRELAELMSAPPREEQAATQPEESNVVRIMSIHQAKGLEFPVVFVPDFAAKQQGPRTQTAIWDARLGCVPNPPDDDDPPLFSKLPSKLWQIQEQMAGWNEDLRTLYVACTRAQDYLVLSGSLTDSPQNTQMTMLAERFDLQSGKCVDGDVSVIVANVDEVQGERRHKPMANQAPLEKRDAEGVAAVPPEDSAGVIWERPRRFTKVALERERIRAVLAEWDLAHSDGWRRPLAALENQRPDRLRGPIAAGFKNFAASELFAKIQAAVERKGAVELALAVEHGPVVRGVIDLVWCDSTGWNFAMFRFPDDEFDLSLARLAMAQAFGDDAREHALEWDELASVDV